MGWAQDAGFVSSYIPGITQVNNAAFEDPNAAVTKALASRNAYAAGSRQTPHVSTQLIGAAGQYGGTQLDPTSLYGGTTLDAAAQYGGTQLGQVAQYGGTTIDTANQGAIRQQQLGSLAGLQGAADGTAPSVAQLQMKQGLADAISAQKSQAASSRGVSPAMAAKLAAENTANLQQGSINQTAMLRAQEMTDARGQFANALQGVRGQDVGLATSQAGLNQETGLANTGALNQANIAQGQLNQETGLANTAATNTQSLAQGQLNQETGLANAAATNTQNLAQGQLDQETGLYNVEAKNKRQSEQAAAYADTARSNQTADLQARQINDAAVQYYTSLGYSVDQAQVQAKQEQELLRIQGIQRQEDARSGQATQSAALNQQIVGGLFSTAASLGGAAITKSDERAKINVDRAGAKGDAFDFLDHLDVASYDYIKPEQDGHGRHYSAMAQSVAKSRMGQTFVVPMSDGMLGLDTRKGFAAALVAMKNLHDRVKRVEVSR